MNSVADYFSLLQTLCRFVQSFVDHESKISLSWSRKLWKLTLNNNYELHIQVCIYVCYMDLKRAWSHSIACRSNTYILVVMLCSISAWKMLILDLKSTKKFDWFLRICWINLTDSYEYKYEMLKFSITSRLIDPSILRATPGITLLSFATKHYRDT